MKNALYIQVQYAAGAFERPICLRCSPASTLPYSLFQSEKAAKHELLTCDCTFFGRLQWIGHGRLAPQVRPMCFLPQHVAKTRFASRAHSQSEECEQKLPSAPC